MAGTENSSQNDRERGDREYEQRADRGPGAHSGREQQPQERTVPGTASATEGYESGGTAGGETLRGVQRDEEEEGDS
ncbi:hypothetical protein [Streptomyces pristinaespiralis]|uniref:hypothetical protein n=1 Tax=Streptomyces pristinaespiralis TaxID=38300 RepID=UPI0033EFFDFE